MDGPSRKHSEKLTGAGAAGLLLVKAQMVPQAAPGLTFFKKAHVLGESRAPLCSKTLK